MARILRLNVTQTPQRFYPADKGRGRVMVRNTDNLGANPSNVTVLFQWGPPSDLNDGFDILAGDVFVADRGDVTPELWFWVAPSYAGGTINSNIKADVG